MQHTKGLLKWNRVLWVILILLLAAAPLLEAAMPEWQQEELDRYIGRYQRTMKIPALAVTIIHQGESVYSRGWGDGVDGSTMFNIASISKSFTGLAIMQLVEQGKVDLTQPVSAYIPEFTISDDIQVTHLLHHVSGMTEFDFMGDLPDDATTVELLVELNGIRPSYEPGEMFSYFNPNYSLLGLIVERVSGMSYADYIGENILAPLGLENVSASGEADVAGNLSVFGYSVQREEPFLLYDLPAGYMTSSADDLARYLEAVRMQDPVLGLTPEGFAQLQEGFEGGHYGMGWMVGEYANRPAVFHGGSLPGFVSDAVMLTEDEYSVVMLANKNHMIHAVFMYPDLMEGIVSILTDQPATDRLTFYWVYRAFGILFILSMLSSLVNWLKLLFSPRKMSRFRRGLTAGFLLLIPVVVFFAVPAVSKAVLQRGFTWELGLLMVPDFLSWLIIGLGFNLLEGLTHLLHYGRRIDQ